MSKQIPKFETVIVTYQCGCSYHNDAWKSACESEALCPVHSQHIKAEAGEWIDGVRPSVADTRPHNHEAH
jgi:hypothetical protein